MDARAVVRLAASRVESSAEVKSWLENDERGSWEREAQEKIDVTRERREREGIPDEIAASEFADQLRFRALCVVLEREKSRKRAR